MVLHGIKAQLTRPELQDGGAQFFKAPTRKGLILQIAVHAPQQSSLPI